MFRKTVVTVAFVIASIWAGAEGMTREGDVHGPVPIIPGAAGFGFGMDTVAGSGRHLSNRVRDFKIGKLIKRKTPKTHVIKVINLKSKGPGSLREALEAKGPRVVVFEVSGNIDFTPYTFMKIKHPYLTVAGQTAPSPGITLKGCELSINTHDVLLQHIRIRVGDLRDPTRPIVVNKAGWTQWSERDCMKVAGKRIVIDHCSFSWASDELVQTTANEVTFRQNLFSECLSGVGTSHQHHKGAHSKALVILDQGPRNRVSPDLRQSQNVAVIGNLFAHNADRHPQAIGGAKVAIINNFMYDASERPAVGITLHNLPAVGSRGGPGWVSIIGNHFDNIPAPFRIVASLSEFNGKFYLKDTLLSYTEAERILHEKTIKKTVDEAQFKDYLSGDKNLKKNKNGLIVEHFNDPWNASHMLIFKKWMGRVIHPEKSKVTEPPVIVPGLKIKSSYEVRSWVLANAGARPAERGPVDARIVKETRERTGKIIGSQKDVGDWPELAENHRKLTIPDNPDSDDDNDGYTNLEEWLHEFAAKIEGKEK